jgi:hypothetical protein
MLLDHRGVLDTRIDLDVAAAFLECLDFNLTAEAPDIFLSKTRGSAYGSRTQPLALRI